MRDPAISSEATSATSIPRGIAVTDAVEPRLSPLHLRVSLDGSMTAVDEDPAARIDVRAAMRQVYDEARRIAHAALRRAPRATWDTSILVNEAFVRLLGSDWAQRVQTDPHLVVPVLRRVMENALADHHRRRGAQKRPEGGQRARAYYEDGMTAFDDDPASLLAILEAIDRLRDGAEGGVEIGDRVRFAQTLELGFVLGCSSREIAARLDLPQTTVSRWIRYGRAVLNRSLERAQAQEHG
jgi:DNA-directed RNA polymerase specialized sigma24 family protein